MQEFLLNKFYGLQFWQYLGIIAFLAGGYLAYRILCWIFNLSLIKIFSKTKYKEILETYFKTIYKLLSLIVVTYIIYDNLGILKLGRAFKKTALIVYELLIPLLIFGIIYKSTHLISDIIRHIASKTNTKFDKSFASLIRRTLKVIIITIAGIYLLNYLKIDITPVLAGVSIGGLAVALAAQETLKNFFGSITIFLDRPFEVGDWIISPDFEGTVEEIGLRSTRIRSFNNSLITVPNSKIIDSVIDNMGKRLYRRFLQFLRVSYETPPPIIEDFISGIQSIANEHKYIVKENIQVSLHEFAEYSINIRINLFLDVPDYLTELQLRQEIMEKILNLANNLNIQFEKPFRFQS